MNELKDQIRYESSRASQLSQQAKTAFAAKNWVQGKALMKEAATASANCQKLIQQFNLQNNITIS
jgi:hypothetical protein